MASRYGPLQMVSFRSAQGVLFGVSYVPRSYGQDGLTIFWADGLEFFVAGMTSTLRPKSRVRAVLVNNYFVNGEYDGQHMHEIDLFFASHNDESVSFAGGLSGEVDSLEYLANNHTVVCKPQVALVIDGNWQADPVQWGEQHNFNFQWAYAPQPQKFGRQEG